MVFLPYYLLFGVNPLIGLWRSHSDYQKFLVENILPVYLLDKKRVSQYANVLTKLYLLDLDRIKPLLSEVYSPTGAPSRIQPEVIRSFILMSHLNVPSISKWVAKLKADSLIALMIGVAPDEVPEVGNHYGLMNRLWLANPDSSDQDSLHTFRRTPRKKLGKNQKLPPRHPGIIQKFVDLALQRSML